MTQEANPPKLSITSIATRTACPVCVALKEFQNDLLKHFRPEQCRHFCNTHGWVVANSAPGEFAAETFLNAIARGDWKPARPDSDQCDLCRKMHDEKEARLDEISRQLCETKLRSWLHNFGVLCSRHGYEVMAKLPEDMQGNIQELIDRNREEIRVTLEAYRQKVHKGDHTGGGVLGRAAEFLVSQRGIES